MALTIALFFFSFVLLGISVGFYIWWKKYGKEIFNMVKKSQITPNLTQTMKNLPNLNDQMRLINELMAKNFKK